MEMIAYYLSKSPVQMLPRIFSIWHTQSMLGTPQIAKLIESLGITRHGYQGLSVHQLIEKRPSNKEEEAIALLAYVIYLIDNQFFMELKDLLGPQDAT